MFAVFYRFAHSAGPYCSTVAIYFFCCLPVDAVSLKLQSEALMATHYGKPSIADGPKHLVQPMTPAKDNAVATGSVPFPWYEDSMNQQIGHELIVDPLYDNYVDLDGSYVSDVSGQTSMHKSPVREQPVFWLHLHQNAGTWLRVSALNSGETPLEPHDSNLNYWTKGDKCNTPMPCKEKLSLVRSQNASWSSIERSFDVELEHCAGDFIYGIGITDPRLFVHKSLQHRYGLHPELLIDVLQGKRAVSKDETWDDLCWGRVPFGDNDVNIGGQFPQYDNFIIRSLLGYNVFWSPPGSINKTHLEKAKAVIRKFDVILIINRLPEHFAQLEHILQWPASVVKSPPVHSNNGDYTPSVFEFNENQTMFLKELNRFDQELFHFAEGIAQTISASATAKQTGRA